MKWRQVFLVVFFIRVIHNHMPDVIIIMVNKLRADCGVK